MSFMLFSSSIRNSDSEYYLVHPLKCSNSSPIEKRSELMMEREKYSELDKADDLIKSHMQRCAKEDETIDKRNTSIRDDLELELGALSEDEIERQLKFLCETRKEISASLTAQLRDTLELHSLASRSGLLNDRNLTGLPSHDEWDFLEIKIANYHKLEAILQTSAALMDKKLKDQLSFLHLMRERVALPIFNETKEVGISCLSTLTKCRDYIRKQDL